MIAFHFLRPVTINSIGPYCGKWVKVDTVNQLPLDSVYRVCNDGECLEMAKELAQGRTVVHVSAQCCQVCRGSDNCRDVTRLNRCLEKCGKRNVIIVGQDFCS